MTRLSLNIAVRAPDYHSIDRHASAQNVWLPEHISNYFQSQNRTLRLWVLSDGRIIRPYFAFGECFDIAEIILRRLTPNGFRA
jgi:hypothetical protein